MPETSLSKIKTKSPDTCEEDSLVVGRGARPIIHAACDSVKGKTDEQLLRSVHTRLQSKITTKP